jgi:peptidyl-prolyl cis-trans isomerase C
MSNLVIDGVEIPEKLIRDEMPNHPAATSAEAYAAAGHALAIKALLLNRARELGIEPRPAADGAGRFETEEEALIRQLFDMELSPDAPTDAECQRFYDSRPGHFLTPALYEASHILLLESAREIADDLIGQLKADNSGFSGLASALSQCPSGKVGGSLGQMQTGDLVAEVEDVLLSMPVGGIYPEPVQSRFGWHILRLDRLISPQRLPLEAVKERIRLHLESRAWIAASAQYVGKLVLQAKEHGIAFKLGDTGEVASPSLSLGALVDDERLADRIGPWLEAVDPDLAGRVVSTAASKQIAAPEFVRREIRDFLDHADDESFTQLVSAAQGAEDPLLASVRTILKSRLGAPRRTLNIRHKS